MTAAYDAQSSQDGFGAGGSFTHTPVGTPRGIVVLIASSDISTDIITGVTYGGVALTRVATNGFVADTAGEVGAVYAYFLGSGIPTGAQTVVVTTADINAKSAWCLSVTAANDTQIAGSGKASGDAANPTVTINTIAGFAGFVAGVLFSGQNAPASITAGSGYTILTLKSDFGLTSGVAERADAKTGASIVVNFTATSEDVAIIGVAVEEVAASAFGFPFVPYWQTSSLYKR